MLAVRPGCRGLYAPAIATLLAICAWTGYGQEGPAGIFDIRNDDEAVFRAAESDPYLTFEIVREGGTDEVAEVSYETADDTAMRGLDYTTTSGRVTFQAGEQSKFVDVPIRDDRIDEDDETVRFRIFGAANAGIQTASALGYIEDDDEPPVLSLPDRSASEGRAALSFKLRLSLASGRGVEVSWRTEEGTAKADRDFGGPRTGTYRFGLGEVLGYVRIPLLDDVFDEGDETFTLVVTEAVHVSVPDDVAQGTIVDDDGDNPGLSVADARAVESDPSIGFVVSLTSATDRQVTVDYQTRDFNYGNVTSDDSYVPTAGTLTLAPGARRATIHVALVDDDEDEGLANHFFLDLSNPSGAYIEDGEAEGRISDDDRPPLASIALERRGPEDMGEMPFVVTLDRTSVVERRLYYETRNGTADHGSDYERVHTTRLGFLPGERVKTISVGIIDDSQHESDEFLNLHLGSHGHTGKLDLAGPDGRVSSLRTKGFIIDDDPPPTLVIEDASAAEDEGPIRFEVRMTSGSESPVTVDYATSDGTARAGADYAATGGSLTFAPGKVRKVIDVAVVDDDLYEGPETFMVTLTNAVNAPTSRARATGTIRNDDDAPALLIRFGAGDATPLDGQAAYIVPEDVGTLAFTLIVSTTVEADIAVSYETVPGTATPPGDYVAVRRTLVFAAGETEKDVEVAIVDDAVVEEDESFGVDLRVGGTVATVGVTVVDNDPALVDGQPALSIADAEGPENVGELVFRLRLEGDVTEPIVVPYRTVRGSAAAPGDYSSRRGTLTFSAGVTELALRVPVVDDDVQEADESFTVLLERPANASVVSRLATGTILDDDPPPTVSVRDASGGEQDGRLGFAVSLSSRSSLPVAVAYATADDSATSGSDYVGARGTLTFRPGETARTVPVTIVDDDANEHDESFRLSLESPSNATLGDATAVGTILDDDESVVTVAARSADEGSGKVWMWVQVTPASPDPVRIRLQPLASAGTATPDADYETRERLLILRRGQAAASESIGIIDDNVDEADERFEVAVSVVQGEVELATPRATVTIRDDDAPPTLSIDDASAPESDGRVRFSTGLSGNESAHTIRVNYDTSDGTANAGADYTATRDGTLTFRPGERLKTIDVPITHDGLYELQEETFAIRLSWPRNVQLPDPDAMGTIIDSDPVPVLTVSDSRAGESEPHMTFPVALAPPADTDIEIFYSTSDGTAEAAMDYRASNGSITFEAGRGRHGVSVPIVDDDLDEPDETLQLLLEPRYISVGDTPVVDVERATATGTILDDDEATDIGLWVGNATAREDDGFLAFEVSLSEPVGREVSVSYATAAGTALPDTDYREVSGALTFAAGTRTLTVPVPLVDDDVPEPNETMALRLSDAHGAEISGSRGLGTILDDDPPLVAIAASTRSVEEGATVVFTLTWSGDTVAERTVAIDVVEAGDYLVDAPPTTVGFRPGQETALLRLATDDDLRDEPDGSLTATVETGPEYVALQASATAEVADNDVRGVDVSPTAITLPEGGVGAYGVRLRTEPLGTVRVAVAVPDGTDLSADQAELTFTPADWNVSQRVDVRAAEDDDFVADDPVPVVHDVRGADYEGVPADTVMVTIIDNDRPSLWIGDRTVEEGDGEMTFEVRLSRAPVKAASVDYATVDRTARHPGDYRAVSGSLSFAPGEASKRLPVAIVDDDVAEDDETLIIALTNLRGALLADGQATGTILDDDRPVVKPPPAAVPVVAVADVAGPEGGGALAFAVTLDRVADHPVTVEYATGRAAAAAGTAAAVSGRDYDAGAGTITIAAGDRQANIEVFLVDDAFVEPDEIFVLALSNARGATLGDAEATGTIEDDDRLELFVLASVSVRDASAPENAEALAFEVALNARSSRSVAVDYATGDGGPGDGGALAGQDYLATSGTLTFAARERHRTINVELLDDAVAETAETMTLVLSNPDGLSIRDGEAEGVIRDDDKAEAGGSITDMLLVLGERRKIDLSRPLQDRDHSTGKIAWTAGDRSPQKVEAESEGDAVRVSVDGHSLTVAAVAAGASRVRIVAAGDVRHVFVVTVAAPAAAAKPLGDVELAMGDGPRLMDLSAHFAGTSLDFAASTSDPGVVATTVEGTALVLTPVAPGAATVTVTAANAHGRASQVFVAAVSDDRERDAAVNSAMASVGRSLLTSVTQGVARRIAIAGRTWDAGSAPAGVGDVQPRHPGTDHEPYGFGIAGDRDRNPWSSQQRPSPPAVSFSLDGGTREDGFSLWGWSDTGRFAADGHDGRSDSVQLGVETPLGERGLLGVSLARTTSEADYDIPRRDADCGTRGGVLRTVLTSAHPYANLPLGSGSVWFVAGAGTGEASLEECGAGARGSAELSMRLGVLGGRQPLATTKRVDWTLTEDAGWLRLDTARGEGPLGRGSAGVGRVRLGLEAALDRDRPLSATLAAAFRRDIGDGATGGGLELATGLRYRHPQGRLTMEAEGRALAVHSPNTRREYGYAFGVGYRPRTDATGLSVALDSRGGIGDTLSDTLWDDAQPWGFLAGQTRARRAGRSRLRLGYGRDAPFGGVSTPFVELEFPEGRQPGALLGVRYAMRAGTTSVDSELAAGTRGGANGSEAFATFNIRMRF